MGGDLTLCGWRVSSELPLPAFLPWAGDDRPVDLTIRLGSVPEASSDFWEGGPVLKVGKDGSCRLGIRNIANYLFRNGREIIVDPILPPDTVDIVLFILGTGLGVISHQRGLLPLHASCVAFGDKAVAFAGDSGRGKSTIAAALLKQGGRLVSDDVAVVEVDAPGGPLVWPTMPQQKLWQDTLTALKLSPGRRLRSTVDIEKFERLVVEGFSTTPVRLALICHLSGAPLPGSPLLEPLRGLNAFDMVQDHIYRFRAARLMNMQARLFRQSASIAATVPQTILYNPFGLAGLLDTIPQLPEKLGLTP